MLTVCTTARMAKKLKKSKKCMQLQLSQQLKKPIQRMCITYHKSDYVISNHVHNLSAVKCMRVKT